MPTPKFSVDPTVEPWNVTAAAWLVDHPFIPQTIDGICTSVLIFHPAPTSPHALSTGVAPRLLVIRRALTDPPPGLWEAPGGGVDAEDKSILAGAAREVREEAGLTVTAFLRFTPFDETMPLGQCFPNSTGTRHYASLVFFAEARRDELPEIGADGGFADIGAVKLDPNEHMDAYWATEKEVREQKRETGEAMEFTRNLPSLLQGFRQWKEIAEARATGATEA